MVHLGDGIRCADASSHPIAEISCDHIFTCCHPGPPLPRQQPDPTAKFEALVWLAGERRDQFEISHVVATTIPCHWFQWLRGARRACPAYRRLRGCPAADGGSRGRLHDRTMQRTVRPCHRLRRRRRQQVGLLGRRERRNLDGVLEPIVAIHNDSTWCYMASLAGIGPATHGVGNGSKPSIRVRCVR